jgi:hypothetical protein
LVIKILITVVVKILVSPTFTWARLIYIYIGYSTLAPLLNNRSLTQMGRLYGRSMQETPRKHTMPTKRPKNRSKVRWKDDVQNEVRKTRIVNWRIVTRDGDGRGVAGGEGLSFLDSGATEGEVG